MIVLAIICQLIVAAVVISVWTVRYNRSTAWRGGEAESMPEEFETYGLSSGTLALTRVTKLTLAGLLIVGVWYAELTMAAALGMATLMLVAVAMHVKVGDAWRKSLPAATMLLLCLIVVYAYQAVGAGGVETAGL